MARYNLSLLKKNQKHWIKVLILQSFIDRGQVPIWEIYYRTGRLLKHITIIRRWKIKTACVHFCSKRKSHDDPCLHLDGNRIKVVKEVKFLGVIFGSKLSFVPHIKMLKEKCTKALDDIKVVAHSKWGARLHFLIFIFIFIFIFIAHLTDLN